MFVEDGKPVEKILPLAAIVAVICLGLMLKILFASGPVGSDDLVYFHAANALLHAEMFPEVNQHYGRILYIVLAGIPAALGGHIIFGALTNILYSSLLDAIVAIFSYRVLGAWPALVATLIISLNGSTLLWSGTLLPDVVLSLFMFSSVASLHCALRTEAKSASRWLLLSGLLAGLAYAAKEPGILLLPPTAIGIASLCPSWDLRQKATGLVIYLGAFAAVFAVMGLAQLRLSDDFLYRVHAVEQGHNQSMPSMSLYNYCRYVWWSIASIWQERRELLLLPLSAGAVAWCVSILRPSSVKVFAICGVFVAAYLTVGSTSLTQLKPIPFNSRYITPVMPFIAVSLAWLFAVADLSSALKKGMWVVFLTAFVVESLSGVAKSAGDQGRARYYKNAAYAVQWAQSQDKPMPVWVGPRTRDALSQFLPCDAVAKLNTVLEMDVLREGYYLLDNSVDATFAQGKTRTYQEVLNLPIVAAVSVNPLNLVRYFPGFMEAAWQPVSKTAAILRKK